MLSAVGAGAVTNLGTTPFFTVKTRLQVFYLIFFIYLILFNLLYLILLNLFNIIYIRCLFIFILSFYC